MKLGIRHLGQHLAEIRKRTVRDLTVIDNQQLNGDILQLGLPADGFNAQRKIADPVARGNDYGYIMHAAAPSGTPESSALL
ncbi:hypothetical protein D3C81_1707250 [compost metagenome]